MKEFLRKVKLLEDYKLELEIQKSEFVSKLKASVDEDRSGMLFDSVDLFSKTKNVYKGYVDFDEFKIKRKKKAFDFNMNVSVVTGTFNQVDEVLVVEAEINGFSGAMIPFYLFAIFFYVLILVVLITTSSFEGDAKFAIPFIVLHGSFMLGLPYFLMRKSVSKMKYELEREFYYLTKK